ncbi:MAG: pyrroloquinoline quinone biosynthesis protein PqqB [Hyphomicrobiales bacterium]|nr:pyrroloquinoline quinone biosynthesis protein PqqB [Hyphomicrobiales bacterium]
MIIRVLGSAAGGGFPQWNCNGANSRDVRAGRAGLKPRTQSALAVSANERDWVLLNASPDIRQQIDATPALHPRPGDGIRNSPIAAVILTNGDVDHVAGLLSLREGQPFTLYASSRVLQALAANSIFNVLAPEKVGRQSMTPGTPFPIAGPAGETGLSAEAFVVPGKVALYLEDPEAGENFGTEEGDTIGLKISDTAAGTSFFYIPGCATLDDALVERLRAAALLFFDGTLYTNDEMIAQGLSAKTGQRMGHMNMSGADGSLAAFEALGVQRRIYIHINNSNPVLRETSPERGVVEGAGWEVAYDGMEVRL